MPIETEGQSIDDLAGLLGTPDAGDGAELEEAEGAEDQTPPTGDQEHTPEGEPEDEQDPDNGGEPIDPDTDPDADPEGEPQDAESDPSTPEPLYPVTIDGKEERVTLKDALAGYQRNADYTRKTQQVAEERRLLDATHAEARAQRDQYSQVLQVLQKQIGPAEGERTEAQWAELRQTNPNAYPAEWADYQRRQEARVAIKAEEGRVAAERQADQVNQFKAVLVAQRDKLHAALPVLKDPTKGPEALGAIRKYAVENAGFSEEEAGKAYDARIILVLDKARQWDAHQAALTAAKTKLRGARQVLEPSARQPAQKPKAAQRAVQMKKFSQSGRIEDAVDLL